ATPATAYSAMTAAARRQPSAVPASSTPSVCPVIGTGVNDKWMEICASSPTKPAAPTTRATSRTSVPGSRSARTTGRGRRSVSDCDIRSRASKGKGRDHVDPDVLGRYHEGHPPTFRAPAPPVTEDWLSVLPGTWRIDRRIDDHVLGASGTFTG